MVRVTVANGASISGCRSVDEGQHERQNYCAGKTGNEHQPLKWCP
jgi:hypothetical protein